MLPPEAPLCPLEVALEALAVVVVLLLAAAPPEAPEADEVAAPTLLADVEPLPTPAATEPLCKEVVVWPASVPYCCETVALVETKSVLWHWLPTVWSKGTQWSAQKEMMSNVV